ncbi:MAG: MucR family transcriptional regulator [Hyphomicrobiaceae bacterium]|nr:MucR family transcriptional regulator [Hyphomicrobiaceae bacterium]
MTDQSDKTDIAALTADIVSAYVSGNAVTAAEVPALIESVSQSLGETRKKSTQPMRIERVPAIPVNKSVTGDYIVCLEDGAKLKSLKRHLRVKHALSPEEYRERWGLPSAYPMVAPNYASKRSALAKKMGLGRKR